MRPIQKIERQFPEKMWPESHVKKLGVSLLFFGLTSGIAIGIIATLLVWRPWS